MHPHVTHAHAMRSQFIHIHARFAHATLSRIHTRTRSSSHVQAVPAHARMHPHPETAVVAVPPLISVVQLSWGNVTQTSPGVPGPFLVQDYSQNENEIGRRRQAPHSPSNGDGFFCKCGYKTEKAGGNPNMFV